MVIFHILENIVVILQKWAIPGLFYRLSVFSNKHYNLYNNICVKNDHPVSGTGIRTHDLLDVSLLP